MFKKKLTDIILYKRICKYSEDKDIEVILFNVFYVCRCVLSFLVKIKFI